MPIAVHNPFKRDKKVKKIKKQISSSKIASKLVVRRSIRVLNKPSRYHLKVIHVQCFQI
jgi:hypothetical protein